MIFELPREHQKCTKIKKMPSKNQSKKGSKKGGEPDSPWSSAAAFAQPVGMEDSCSRKVFAMIVGGSLYTPPLPAECGGLSSLTRRPPHSTKLLPLVYVKKLIRILAISGRTLAIHGRILHQKMHPRLQTNCQETINHHQQISPKI